MEQKASLLYGSAWICFLCSLFLPAVVIRSIAQDAPGPGSPLSGFQCLISVNLLWWTPPPMLYMVANIGFLVSVSPWGWRCDTKAACLGFAKFNVFGFLVSLIVPVTVVEVYAGYFLWVAAFLLLSGAFFLKSRSCSPSRREVWWDRNVRQCPDNFLMIENQDSSDG